MRFASLAAAGLAFTFGSIVAAGCAAPTPDAREEEGHTAAHETASSSGDGCDPAAGKARLEATFNRTADCATDAISAGLADKVKLAGQSVQDTRRIVAAIQSVASKVKVTNVSTARAILCVRSVSDYVTAESARTVIKGASVGLTDEEIDGLYDSVGSTFSFGASSVFGAFRKVEANPNLENTVEFLTSFAGAIATMGEFITTCGSVLQEFGAVSIPSIATYAQRFANLGVATSIAKCGFAVLGNARDVGKELMCFYQDIQHIKEQRATLQRMNDNRCNAFSSMVNDPSLLPLLNASGTSDARREACYDVIHHWGSCVYDAHRSGVFGDKRLTCDECRTVCSGYVNGAGQNAYLQPVLDKAYSGAGATKADVQRLVHQASMSCGSVSPDGLQPCINFCRGQTADCK